MTEQNKKFFKVKSGEKLISVINPYRQGLWSVWKLTNEEAVKLAQDLLSHSRKETEETMNPFEDQQGHDCRSIEGDEIGGAT
tara:strand:+ start:1109 stop:1354 length:246 start_codon:yes stop_codon:yes gene_type:complete